MGITRPYSNPRTRSRGVAIRKLTKMCSPPGLAEKPKWYISSVPLRCVSGTFEYLACDEQTQRRFLKDDGAADREARGLALLLSDLP